MPKNTETPPVAEPFLVACTVLDTVMTYGLAELAPGAKVHLPEADAKKLEGLGKLRIDGL